MYRVRKDNKTKGECMDEQRATGMKILEKRIKKLHRQVKWEAFKNESAIPIVSIIAGILAMLLIISEI